MSKQNKISASAEAMDILSRFVLQPAVEASKEAPRLQQMTEQEFESFLALANSNHVVIRGMEVYRRIMLEVGDEDRAQRAGQIIADEHARIDKATTFARRICDAFVDAGLDITVMKSLDHWPDFGSDIDLYTNSDPAAVTALMQTRFNAVIAARSWGDRLAGKWNFDIPGLPEAVEIHMCRLGQTGEHITLAANVPARSRVLKFGEKQFRVTSASDRILISTLQRMYRHFYFRLCDIVDSAGLIRSGSVDFEDLRRAAKASGIWEGTATYLVLVSDYVKRYTGTGIDLPDFVLKAAKFDGSVMYCGGIFLRVPIMPQAAGLYRSQLFDTLRRGEVHSSARLGLLPCLATAAAIGYKITGSDKGIW